MASKKSFPDLNKDGKVTKADILKGRGVEGFSDGGRIRRPAPVEEPFSDDPLEEALEQERRIREANPPRQKRKKNTNPGRPDGESGERRSRRVQHGAKGTFMAPTRKPTVDRIAPKTEDTKTFADGGMVRGCKGVQMTGKGFKGTF